MLVGAVVMLTSSSRRVVVRAFQLSKFSGSQGKRQQFQSSRLASSDFVLRAAPASQTNSSISSGVSLLISKEDDQVSSSQQQQQQQLADVYEDEFAFLIEEENAIVEEEEEAEADSLIIMQNNDGDEIEIPKSTTTSNTDTDLQDMETVRAKLKQELRQYRIDQSKPNNKPAYTIFTNAALDEICTILPSNDDELLSVKGIGPKKLDMFGTDILNIVQRYTSSGTLLPGQVGGDSDSSSNAKKSLIPRPEPTISIDTLTNEQKLAATMAIEQQKNVFISGAAGTGKSHLSKYIIQTLSDDKQNEHEDEPQPKRKCAPTSPTGVAAINIGGSTLHAFFGIGLGVGSISSLVKKVRKNKGALKRIEETDVLLIDEVSMLSSDLLETIDAVVRVVRNGGKNSNIVMGGMQVICVGDFHQLPPIVSKEYQSPGLDIDEQRLFCFDSPVWKELELDKNTIQLQQALRQDSGSKFELFLNMVRVGSVTHNIIRDLNAKCLISEAHPIPNDGIIPTRIYTHNRNVDAENETRLNELDGKLITCTAIDEWKEVMPTGTLASIKKNMKTSIASELPDEINLKVGAQVMLTRNKDMESGDRSLVNGSRGVVESFVESDQIPVVRFDNGRVEKVPRVETLRYNPDGGKFRNT